MPETSARSLCGDKFATLGAGLWQGYRCSWYAEDVPGEVMTPLGPPGEDDVILLGHSALDALSLSSCCWATAREPFRAEWGRRNEGNQTGYPDRASCNAAKETRKETYQKSLVPKETKKVLGRPTARNHGRFPARAQMPVRLEELTHPPEVLRGIAGHAWVTTLNRLR